MGEVIRMQDYLERKAAAPQPNAVTERLAQIALEMLLLQSEKNQLLKQLNGPDNPGA